MRSYVDTRLGTVARLRELLSLYSVHSRNVRAEVEQQLKTTRYMEAKIEEAFGRPLEDAVMLEIGAGHGLTQLSYFSLRARSVVGIDTDVLPGKIADYFHIWRRNGPLRTIKTIARQGLGLDAMHRRELALQLGVQELPKVRVLQMDASSMSFPDQSFDAVYSRAVFEHLPDPRASLREVRRVLKPGGVAILLFHLFTSFNGCHDARVFANDPAIPRWAHLRPQYQHLIHENAYLNHLRLQEWRDLFNSELPGSVIIPWNDSSSELRETMAQLKASGELSDYADDELLSVTTEGRWLKPVSLDHQAESVARSHAN